MIITLKSGPYAGQKMIDLVALAKGLIGPNDLANGGEMSPQAASRLISMVFKDAFLEKITTERMTRLERDVDVLDIARRQLVRVAQGAEPNADQTPGASEFGCVLRALSVQLFPTLKLDFLRANKDNPNLPKMVEDGFATRLQTDLVDLAFNGVGDTGEGATPEAKFLNLNKGWVQIAKDAANTTKKDIDPAVDTWTVTLAEIMDAADTRYRANSVFVMNEADADAYGRELGAHVTGTALRADSPLRRFEGKPIEAHPLMPKGHVLFTPLKNLVFGIHTDIRRDRGYHTRKRVLEYTFDQAVDFEIAVKAACVLAQPV